MIKIAFVIDKICSPTAGTEKQLCELISKLDRKKVTPYLCVLRMTPWVEKNFDLCKVFNVDINSITSFKGLSGVVKFTRFLKTNNIDIVQLYFFDSYLVGLIASFFLKRVSVVGAVRNQGYSDPRYRNILFYFCYKLSTALLTNSFATKEYLLDHYKVKEDDVTVIYNGYSLSSRDGSLINKRAFKASIGISDEMIAVVIVANLRPVKDHFTLIEAASTVLKRANNFHFVIIGHGPLLNRLKVKVEQEGLANSFVFLGERKDVETILPCFDIGVLTSTSESFSNAIVEYMYTGLPVVATDVGGVRELIKRGENGYVVPVGNSDELAECMLQLADKDLRDKIRTNNIIKAKEKFEFDKIVNEYYAFYHKVVTKLKKS